MVNNKRSVRTYKVKDAFYKNGMKRAKKQKTTLAEEVERFVQEYANGSEIKFTSVTSFDYGGVSGLNNVTEIVIPQPTKAVKK